MQVRNGCGNGLLNLIIRTGSAAGDEEGRDQAKRADHTSEDPGTLFQHISCLFNTHELVAEPSDIACQATTFRVLYQYDKT